MGVTHADVVPFSTSAPSYGLTLPASGIAAGSRLYVFAVVAADNRTFTPSGGPTLTSLTPTGAVSQSGHKSYAWAGAVGPANHGQTITFTMGGTQIKCVFGYVIVDDPHASAPDHLVLGATGSGTNHAAPSGSTTAAGCIEIQMACDSRGASTPNTSDWTPPAAMSSGSDEGFNTGTTAFCSMAIGWNATPLASGTGVGGDTWAANQSALGSTWTIAVRTLSVTPEAVYTRTEYVEVDARGSTGTVTLTQTGGTAAAITEPTPGLFRIVKPAAFSANLTFDLVAGGADTEVITITPAGATSKRVVCTAAHPTNTYA